MTKKSHHELNEGQMIITFADLEGDLNFLERSLALYKQIYRENFPDHLITEEDLTLVTQNGKTYIKLPDNVFCVNIGDLTDKSRSNTGQKKPRNIRLVEIINNTHEVYGEQMVSILGNRETTKFRILNELNIEHINTTFQNDVLLSPEELKKTGAARDSSLVWVDGPAKPFLTYLRTELKWPEGLNSDELTGLFNQLTEIQKTILYTKWMLANSTGAPALWEDLALELGFAHWEEDKIVVDKEEETLRFVKEYFTNPNSPYVKYLSHCQLGAQIGSTLFTHGGIEDNSFILPKTLKELVDQETLSQIFKGNIPQENGNGMLIARDLNELLDAENTWYAALFDLYSKANTLDKQSTLRLNKGLAELINMGLPAARNNGASLINIKFTDDNGAFGNSLKEETFRKLSSCGVHELYHGHMPAERPRIGKTVYHIDDKEIVLHRIGADTCNYRKHEAAIATTIQKRNGLNHLQIDQIDQSEDHNRRTTMVPLKNQDGTLVKKNLQSLIGTPVKLSDTDKGWNIVRYLRNEQQFELFKQNGPPDFKPETKVISIASLIDLFSKELMNKEKALDRANRLTNETSRTLDETLKQHNSIEENRKALKAANVLIDEKNKEIKKLEKALAEANWSIDNMNKLLINGMRHVLEFTNFANTSLKFENAILKSLVNNETEHKYFALIQNKLLPMTQEYYAYLKSQDLTTMDETKIKRTQHKIALMEQLIQELNDTDSYLRPSDRVNQFFITLNNGAETLKVHRDSFSRYITKVLTAAQLLISTLLVHLGFLAPFIPNENIASNPMNLWKSRGTKLHENLEEARKSMSLN
ncbi:hypothetical protein Lgra_0790 [Legionella gratiana]|uniref:Uncharacterized protein n=1 Tax=Legionella gratiana TaxID=45066 RepID=A0A378JDS4_9GAMM|nr:hypothetical protein [Legionella gratiana]KTD13655.1 hypothetical protein Lgra_0790 [Legionella gratiana]STX46034.1 Uncharacterised protein [Legionella gratiana]